MPWFLPASRACAFIRSFPSWRSCLISQSAIERRDLREYADILTFLSASGDVHDLRALINHHMPARSEILHISALQPAGDLLGTLAVEATIHHLDLVAGDESLAGPSGPGLAVARQTLDGVLGEPVPVGWDDVEYVLKATGRAELTAGDRAGLGVLAARFPLPG